MCVCGRMRRRLLCGSFPWFPHNLYPPPFEYSLWGKSCSQASAACPVPGPNYLEIDMDVHNYAYIARKAFHSFIHRLAPVVFENAFVVQGEHGRTRLAAGMCALAAAGHGRAHAWPVRQAACARARVRCLAPCCMRARDASAKPAGCRLMLPPQSPPVFFTGNRPEELPEQVLAAARVYRVDFTKVGPSQLANAALVHHACTPSTPASVCRPPQPHRNSRHSPNAHTCAPSTAAAVAAGASWQAISGLQGRAARDLPRQTSPCCAHAPFPLPQSRPFPARSVEDLGNGTGPQHDGEAPRR